MCKDKKAGQNATCSKAMGPVGGWNVSVLKGVGEEVWEGKGPLANTVLNVLRVDCQN